MWSTAKIAGLFIVFGLSFTSSLLPCITVRCLVHKLGVSTKFQWAIGVLNCFAGGVFFATSVLDLLPEARESMEDALKDLDIDTDFPLTECIMGMGFLFILFLEHCAHVCCSKDKEVLSESDANTDLVKKKPKQIYSTVEYHKQSKLDGIRSVTDDVVIKEISGGSTLNDGIQIKKYRSLDAESTAGLQTKKPHQEINQNERQDDQPSQQEPHTDTKIIPGKHENMQTSTALVFIEKQSQEDHKLKALRGIILLTALSIHMVFDGLALGLLEKESKIWQLTLALGIHKVLVFFTIGLQLLELLKSTGKTITAGLFFSLVSPLGILIGELINSTGDDVTRVVVTAILQSVATGTFLFVTFFEILQPEFNSETHEIVKVLSTTIGFALIAVIKLFTHED